MQGFIKFATSDEVDMVLSVDQIASFGPEDRYRPTQGVRIRLKDGTSVRTSWRHSVESIEEQFLNA